jgi:hypothetical protein
MTLRYDHLTGGVAERRTPFLVRRHLHFGWAEWDALPWWQQRAYLEELVREMSDGDDPDGGADEIDAADVLAFNGA